MFIVVNCWMKVASIEYVYSRRVLARNHGKKATKYAACSHINRHDSFITLRILTHLQSVSEETKRKC